MDYPEKVKVKAIDGGVLYDEQGRLVPEEGIVVRRNGHWIRKERDNECQFVDMAKPSEPAKKTSKKVNKKAKAESKKETKTTDQMVVI